MRINVNSELKTPDGKPVWLVPPKLDDEGTVVTEGEPMHLHNVLVQVALSPSTKKLEPRNHVIRYALALGAHKAKDANGGTFNISRKVVQEIETDLCHIFAPIVGGQALLMMGYTLDDLAELFDDDLFDELRAMLGGSPKAS